MFDYSHADIAAMLGKNEAAIRQLLSRPFTGARAATRLAMGLVRRWRGRLQIQVTGINGQPGMLVRVDGQIRLAWALEVDGRHIHTIYSVVNPDKLRSLQDFTPEADSPVQTPPETDRDNRGRAVSRY